MSDKEAVVIACFDNDKFIQLSPEQKARWVKEMVLILKNFHIEKREIQAFCDIARKQIKNELSQGSEFINDLTDKMGRSHCVTLKNTDYFPTKADDIQRVAGYFRHIYSDPDQREKYGNYLQNNPSEKEKFLKYWADADNLTRYYLKANKEPQIIDNINAFAAGLQAQKTVAKSKEKTEINPKEVVNKASELIPSAE